MSETVNSSGDQPDPSLHGKIQAVIEELESVLAYREEHGTKSQCAQAISEIESAIATLNYHQAALSNQLEIDVVQSNSEKNPGSKAQGQLNRGAASAVALARRSDPHGFQAYLENCRILFQSTPHLAAAFSRGEFTEAQIRAILTPLHSVKEERRTEFDDFFAKNPKMFENLGNRKISDAVYDFTLTYASDQQCKEQKSAEEKRFVKFTPNSRTGMMRVNGSIPISAGMAMKNDMKATARSIKAKGDSRTRAQIEADYFSSFCTNSEAKIPLTLTLGLVMTDKTLFLGDRNPAHLEGYGVIAPQYARELVAGQEIMNNMTLADMAATRSPAFVETLEATVELIRLYTAPGDKELIAMDSKARIFPEKMKKFVKIRDRHCRTPFCDGTIEEIDHVTQAYLGGHTCVVNSDGRCKLCNQAKETPGWQEFVLKSGPHSMLINTGMGIKYRSTAPPATGFAHKPYPQHMSEADWVSTFEEWLNRPPDTGSSPPGIEDIPA
ncbi:DUF222 domain-containing protein [Glutamicibacter mishrai]|uniref:DUF222 domain-containing protein n=1 Tax=Glutamicibacter mishrai TaxID=1775880 RepID=UPI0020CC10AE|nr:DUF222 domain-containing protein [Glutamicibacter mishrai]UTT39110.1 DUF222 domain-containing protein [Glutamicibacter mishrai]